MANQSVEVVRRSGPRVSLHVDDYLRPHGLGVERYRHASRLLERRAVGHVDDYLELALVIEREHLHLHEADVDETHRGEQQKSDSAEKAPARRGMRKHS